MGNVFKLTGKLVYAGSNMFDLGWQEILLILGMLFFVVDPKKLPEIARKLGKMWQELNKTSANIMEAVVASPTLSASEENPESKPVVSTTMQTEIRRKEE